jgi:hypothetical protein
MYLSLSVSFELSIVHIESMCRSAAHTLRLTVGRDAACVRCTTVRLVRAPRASWAPRRAIGRKEGPERSICSTYMQNCCHLP